MKIYNIIEACNKRKIGLFSSTGTFWAPEAPFAKLFFFILK